MSLWSAIALGLVAVGAMGCSDDGEPTTGATTPSSADASSGGPAGTVGAAAGVIALRGDGLGVTDLGADPRDAIAAVTEALGQPDADSGWGPASGAYGACPGEEVRAVEWGGLVLLFTDGSTPHGLGPHLFAWRISSAPPPLATSAGFGLGARTSDAEQLHPGAVEVVAPEEPFPGFLELEVDGGTITAYLAGDTVTNLEAGAPCGE